MTSAGSENQVVFRNVPGVPLVLASTDPNALNLGPNDSARLSIQIRTKVGGPLPDRFVIEKVDDFALAVYKDRIEFVSGSVQSSAAIDFAELASKTFSTHISVLWSRYKLAVFCGTKMCIELDRFLEVSHGTSHRTLPSTSTILLDSKLASRLQRLVWTKNSLPVVRVACDGSGGDITVSWIQYRPDHVQNQTWLMPVLIAISVMCFLLFLYFFVRIRTSPNVKPVVEMQLMIAELQALPRSPSTDKLAQLLKEHLAVLNRRLQMHLDTS